MGVSMVGFTYTLKLFLAGIPEFLLIETSKEECDRLTQVLEEATVLAKTSRYFFNFTSADGAAYAINLKYLEAAHFLWEATAPMINEDIYQGDIEIHLYGRRTPITASVETGEEQFSLFYSALEMDTDAKFLGFEDMDAEKLLLQVDNIVYMKCSDDLI